MTALLGLSIAFFALTLGVAGILGIILRRRFAVGRDAEKEGSVAERVTPPAEREEHT